MRIPCLDIVLKKGQETEKENDTFLECEQKRKLILEAPSPCQFRTLLRDFIRSNLSIYQNGFTILFLILALIV